MIGDHRCRDPLPTRAEYRTCVTQLYASGETETAPLGVSAIAVAEELGIGQFATVVSRALQLIAVEGDLLERWVTDPVPQRVYAPPPSLVQTIALGGFDSRYSTPMSVSRTDAVYSFTDYVLEALPDTDHTVAVLDIDLADPTPSIIFQTVTGHIEQGTRDWIVQTLATAFQWVNYELDRVQVVLVPADDPSDAGAFEIHAEWARNLNSGIWGLPEANAQIGETWRELSNEYRDW